MELSQRMFVFDKIKENANKLFHKENYYDAMKNYERVILLF